MAEAKSMRTRMIHAIAVLDISTMRSTASRIVPLQKGVDGGPLLDVAYGSLPPEVAAESERGVTATGPKGLLEAEH